MHKMAKSQLFKLLYIVAVCSLIPSIRTDNDLDDVSESGSNLDDLTVGYKTPNTNNLLMAELFDEDWEDRWVISEDPKFTGGWIYSLRAKEAIIGDYGIKTEHESRHHAISRKMTEIAKLDQTKPFVLQYEAKFEEELMCGGAYLKLFDSSSIDDLKFFNNETPYVIMFGPDRCGATNKVHFILKVKNPITQKWEEHHATNPPLVPNGSLSHLYTLIIRPDNSFDIMVDNAVEKKGNLLEDMTPPINPPKLIDDPDDKKPSDWVDEEQIPDTTAVKPDDWDEDAPKRIPDPEASQPSDWLESEASFIRDPAAIQPEDWDEEEDGEWEAPMVANPVCATVSGCGEWKAPMINNPDYKGKWSAPMIANPEYKGQWRANQIENPDYYEINEPHKLAKFDAIGFELWVIQKGLLFDNIIISNDEEARSIFTKETFEVRKSLESAQSKAFDKGDSVSDEGLMSLVQNIVSQNPVPISVAVGIFVLLIFSSNRCFRKSAPATKNDKTSKKVEQDNDNDADESANETTDKKEEKGPVERRKSSTKGKTAEGSRATEGAKETK